MKHLKSKLAIYIHWPFCKSKCPYCDFNSHVRNNVDHQGWLKAYLTEIEFFAHILKDKIISSIFFGGGTPSLMPPFIVEAIINKLAQLSEFSNKIEITIEANPTSAEINNFKDFKQAGVNRISIGVQALNEQDLKFLGREHDKSQALKAIEYAGGIFNYYSFDLIYARPNQTLKTWEEELKEAISYSNGHLSLYQLTIEKGTKFFTAYQKKDFELPNEELASELFILTQQITADHNLPAYEISNHASPGHESRHNLTYWRYEDYLGIGPGARGRLDKTAMMMTYLPENWYNLVEKQNHGIQQQTQLSKKELFEELLIMGLRIAEGIHLRKFEELCQSSFESLVSSQLLKQLLDEHFITLSSDNLSVTDKGKLVLNQIIKKLID